MRDIIKDLNDYRRLYDGKQVNPVKLEDVERIAQECKSDPFLMLQAFCNIGYMRGYRAGQKDKQA